ncbi:hypothetical protein D9619_011100 [Psilocybe cf. subviscida]|uniref:Uncharacterized protein n=1 Tax=Psilocybe cf. subviscida TaxID=2480587 RepID=A0A8H5BJK6_9AGAR|nr:hypothetical protein D9619_011100 [Psilocybe cf. subviscida]
MVRCLPFGYLDAHFDTRGLHAAHTSSKPTGGADAVPTAEILHADALVVVDYLNLDANGGQHGCTVVGIYKNGPCECEEGKKSLRGIYKAGSI